MEQGGKYGTRKKEKKNRKYIQERKKIRKYIQKTYSTLFADTGNDLDSLQDFHIPTAIRKGTRSCTQHPIANHVSYDNL